VGVLVSGWDAENWFCGDLFDQPATCNYLLFCLTEAGVMRYDLIPISLSV
jgi:hypothetical protein